MNLADIIRKAHHLLEAQECRRISAKEMANRIGVSFRTYTEYQRGTNEPLAMKAVLNILACLDNDEIIKIISTWRER